MLVSLRVGLTVSRIERMVFGLEKMGAWRMEFLTLITAILMMNLML